MQLIKCQLLQNSKDPTIRELYKKSENLNAKLSRVWKATNVSKKVNAEVDLNLKFPSQQGHQGLGFGLYNPHPSHSERRELVKSKANSFLQESYLAHSVSLKQQSVWLQWSENTIPFDFSWQNLIWGCMSTEVFKFVLSASVNWACTLTSCTFGDTRKTLPAAFVELQNARCIIYYLHVHLLLNKKDSHGNMIQFYL